MIIKEKHNLKNYSSDEKVAYLSILSAIAYADKDFSSKEKELLDKYLTLFELTDEEKAKIYSSVFVLKGEQKKQYLDLIDKLQDSELKFTLIYDLLLMAKADDDVSEEEMEYIYQIAEYLGINHEQVEAINQLQDGLLKQVQENKLTRQNVQELFSELIAKLSSLGITIATISAAGTVEGLSAAGITSGLAALGGILGGGMLTGAVVVVPAIAISTTIGIKKSINFISKKLKLKNNGK